MKTLKELEEIREKTLKNLQLRNHAETGIRIVVGMGTCGISAGARPVLNELVNEVNQRQVQDTTITQTGCIGMCTYEPMFDVYDPQGKTTYVHMTPEKVKRVVHEHLVNGHVVSEYTIGAVTK